MNKRKFIKLILLIFCIAISDILVFKYCNLDSKNFTLSYKLISDKQDTYQLYYGGIESWTEEKSEKVFYVNANKQETLKYDIPKDIQEMGLRLGNQQATINISDLQLSCFGKKINLDTTPILDKQNELGINKITENEKSIYIETSGENSFLKYKLDSNIITYFNNYINMLNIVLKILLCLLLDLLMIIVMKKSKSVLMLVHELNNNKILIWNLSKNDFRTKYAGSYLGIVWAFIQPIVTIIVYWIVFEFGLRASAPITGVPYILWFMAGLVPWFFFQEALINATNCMVEYSYLVKKVVFKISILPIVKIISALFVQLVFIIFLFVVAIIYGFYPSRYTVQLVYYLFCTFSIILSISYATSAVVLFFKDLGQIISIFLQVGMWATPIMWSYTMVPEKLQWIVKLNPVFYIVEGYRDTFISHIWFGEKYFQTIYFWIITLALFGLGAWIFKKLKPHFADVL